MTMFKTILAETPDEQRIVDIHLSVLKAELEGFDCAERWEPPAKENERAYVPASFMNDLQLTQVKSALKSLSHRTDDLDRRLHDKSRAKVSEELNHLEELIQYAKKAVSEL